MNTQLIKCSMCSKFISPNAITCPNCGEPMMVIAANNEISKYYSFILLDAGENKELAKRVVQAITKAEYEQLEKIMNNLPKLLVKNATWEYANILQTSFKKIGASTRLEIIQYETKKDLKELSRFHISKIVAEDNSINGDTSFYSYNGMLMASQRSITFNNKNRTDTFIFEGKTIKPILKAEFQNIKNDGIEVYYGSRGQLLEYKEYKHGKLHGKRKAYSYDNVLLYECEFAYGKKYGTEVRYSHSGEKQQECKYKDGRLNGKQLWYKGGKVDLESEYKEGELIPGSCKSAAQQSIFGALTPTPQNTIICANNQVKCPNCGSTSICAVNKGFSLGKAAAGGLMLGAFGLLGGFINSTKIVASCISCGHRWVPRSLTRR